MTTPAKSDLPPTHPPTPLPASLLGDLYSQLRAAAQQQMARERPDHTLTATALVHEAWLRLAGPREIPFEQRAHLYTAAIEAMRHVLLDHAKARGRKKRGGGKPRAQFELDTLPDLTSDAGLEDYLALDESIERLRSADPRAAEVVRLRLLGGLSVAETAALLGVSERTIKNEWAFARAWLARNLGGGRAAPE